MSVRVPMRYSERITAGAATAAPSSAASPALRGMRRAEDSVGAHEQDQDEEREDGDLRERAVQIESAQRFDDTHEQTAEQRARERAETAQHDDHDSGDDEDGADVGRHVEERHRHGP